MNRLIKVLHVIGNFDADRGGAQKIVLAILNGVNSDIFQNQVLHFFGDGSLAKECEFPVLVSGLKAASSFDLRIFYRVRTYISEHRPDIVHIHSVVAGLYARGVCSELGIPTITTVHSSSYPYLHRTLEARSINKSKAVVAVSMQAENSAISSLGVDRSLLSVVYNGVDIQSISSAAIEVNPLGKRKELGLSEHDCVLCCIGRHTKAKGLDVLLKAMVLMIAVRPCVKLVLVGSGDATDGLKCDANSMGLNKNVSFIGARTDVFEVLQATDICVFPSRWEGFGLAAVEAMAAGKCVAASNIDVFKEVLGDSATYFELTPEAISKTLLEIIEDRRTRDERALAGQKFALERYSLQTMCNKYEALYQRVLEDNDG